METFVKPVQPENAEPPILVTEFGILISVNQEQSRKRQAPISVTELLIVIVDNVDLSKNGEI